MAIAQSIVVTCSPGISTYLSKEISDMGYTLDEVKPMSVSLRGSMEDCIKLNLHLRTANRVLYLIRKFRAAHPDQLYQAVSRIPWEDYIPRKGYISVTGFIKNKHILDTRFGNQKTKDAIVDRLLRIREERPDSGPSREHTVVYIYWVEDQCDIYFDTSGETISKHGYRRMPGKAPMRESLAAAVLMASKWEPGMTLVNPMGGSGTLAIEAALMTKRIAPGLLRENFGFMHLRTYKQEVWKDLRQSAENSILKDVDHLFHVSDKSLEALRSAEKNAEWAGVKPLISFTHSDFRKLTMPAKEGVLILNPEYGTRMGEVQALAETYRSIGDFFKEQCAGFWGYVFTGNPELSKRLGLRTSRKIPFYNGQLECRLLEFELYKGSKKSTKGV